MPKDRKQYMNDYHKEYRFLKKLESGVVQNEPMKRLKNRITEYVDEELNKKLLLLEQQLNDRKHKQLDYMKQVIKLIQHNPESEEFHKLIDKLEELDDLAKFASLDEKLEYYENILEGI
jgi:transcriptional/translational regulatory protein YebC/TACO1